jgi:hypothetical protein
VAIEFSNLLGDEGWAPMPVDQSNPRYFWHDGGPLADAPVDMEATFDGGMWISTKVDRSFNLNGLRCRPNFTVPRHHHNMRELIVVFGGEFTVEWGPDGGEGRRTIGAGQFWVSDAGTPYMMTAGPEGVTYMETWPGPAATLETYWHEGGWIERVRR